MPDEPMLDKLILDKVVYKPGTTIRLTPEEVQQLTELFRACMLETVTTVQATGQTLPDGTKIYSHAYRPIGIEDMPPGKMPHTFKIEINGESEHTEEDNLHSHQEE